MPPIFRRVLKPLLCASFLAAIALHGSPARADDTDNPYDGKLTVGITPYVWLPTLNATFKYNLSDLHEDLPSNSGSFESQIGPNSYLTHLNFALMAAASIRKGNLALYTDLINVNVSNQSATIFNLVGPMGKPYPFTGTVGAGAVATLWTIGPSYTVYHDKGTSVDVLVGGRFAWMKGSVDYSLTGPNGILNPNGSASKTVTLSDGLIGTYGKFGLGSHWSVPFYFDIGTGTPSFTWEGLLGIKYGQLSLAYRHLDYQSGTALVQNLTLSGPMLGYSFRF